MTMLDQCYNIFDLREMAQRRLPKGIFEYVDKGTEDGISLAQNREAFHRLKLHTHFLNDWSRRDLGTEIFGQRINLLFGIAPTGSAGLMWYQGEVELARAAGAARAIKILSDEMERSFGYIGARRVSEIGPHIFASGVPGK